MSPEAVPRERPGQECPWTRVLALTFTHVRPSLFTRPLDPQPPRPPLKADCFAFKFPRTYRQAIWSRLTYGLSTIFAPKHGDSVFLLLSIRKMFVVVSLEQDPGQSARSVRSGGTLLGLLVSVSPPRLFYWPFTAEGMSRSPLRKPRRLHVGVASLGCGVSCSPAPASPKPAAGPGGRVRLRLGLGVRHDVSCTCRAPQDLTGQHARPPDSPDRTSGLTSGSRAPAWPTLCMAFHQLPTGGLCSPQRGSCSPCVATRRRSPGIEIFFSSCSPTSTRRSCRKADLGCDLAPLTGTRRRLRDPQNSQELFLSFGGLMVPLNLVSARCRHTGWACR